MTELFTKTDSGITKKTLTIFMVGVNVGKSLFIEQIIRNTQNGNLEDSRQGNTSVF